jgi:DNA-binding response OmpR family regulator
VIEDNSITAKALQYDLKLVGYDVLVAFTAQEVLEYITYSTFDLLIADINLGDPSINGIDLVKILNKTKNIPVIYLTGNGDDGTLEDVAQTNHSYYVSKPYDSDALLKIVKLTINRYKMNNIEKVYLDKNIIYDMMNRVIYYNDKEIKLTSKENLFLSLLFYRKNQIVSDYEIAQYVWDDAEVSAGSIRQLISRARAKFIPLSIETHHGEGYRLRVKSIY